jgi:hypothetical protein
MREGKRVKRAVASVATRAVVAAWRRRMKRSLSTRLVWLSRERNGCVW